MEPDLSSSEEEPEVNNNQEIIINNALPELGEYIEESDEEESSDEEPEYLGRVVRSWSPTRILTIRDTTYPPVVPVRRAVRHLLSSANPVLYFQTSYPSFIGRATSDPTDGSRPRVYAVYRTGENSFLAIFRYSLPCGQHLFVGQDPGTY